MNDPQPPLVCDTTVVLNLGERGGLTTVVERLRIERTLYVTPEVTAEVIRNGPEYYVPFIELHFHTVSETVAEWTDEETASLEGLETGELSVLGVCRIKGWLAGVDELAGRKAARRLGIKLMGTVGILERGVALGWLTDGEGLDALRRLRARGFHCPKVLANDDFADYIARLK